MHAFLNPTRTAARASGTAPLAQRLSAQLADLNAAALGQPVIDKAKTCLYDLIGCAFEARDKPWSRQALAMAAPLAAGQDGGASIIGSVQASSFADAAFVNAVMGHGLVREDMHAASISHLGVAVIPAVLALSQRRRVSGADFLAAMVAGYEVGAQIGRVVMDPQRARIFRPTGITGPLAAAAAGARLLRLDAAQAASAIALAANTTAGFNQWGHTGGSEMFFHPGFAARNGVSAVLLAEAGAFGSPDALEGESGLFAAHGKRDAAAAMRLFDGQPEILAVYHKPVPACNFAQTACLAALVLARAGRCPAERIAAIRILVPRAGATYPGCDFLGPYAHVLQAKMSIQYNVAAALLTGAVTEANFDLLQDVQLQRLLAVTRLEVDQAMTRDYPGRQGGAVEIRLADGTVRAHRLDDVVNASPAEVLARFRSAAAARIGSAGAARIEALVTCLEHGDDAGQLAASLAAATRPARAGATSPAGQARANGIAQ